MIELVAGFVTGLVAGLWWGERGRRIDAQKAARTYRPSKPQAHVVQEQELETVAVEQMFNDEQVEKMILDTMNETGCSRKKAEEDVGQMLAAGAMLGFEH